MALTHDTRRALAERVRRRVEGRGIPRHVIDDAIAIRPVCHVTLGYDHRLVDGADAGRFLSFFKERLENFDEAWT